MKNYFTLVLLILVLFVIGFSCKKKGADTKKDVAQPKTTTSASVDSTSVLGFTVNGVAVGSTSIITTRDTISPSYSYAGGTFNSGGTIFIHFSGSTVQASTIYTIVASYDTLGKSPGRCHFAFVGNTGSGFANAGVVTTSQASSHRIGFSNIIAPSTSSNSLITYTLSGILPYY